MGTGVPPVISHGQDGRATHLPGIANARRFIYCHARHRSFLRSGRDLTGNTGGSAADHRAGFKMKNFLPGRLIVALTAAMMLGHSLAAAQTYNLMPQPAEIEPGSGRLVIDGSFRVALDGYREPRLEAAAARLIRRLSLQTAIPLSDGLENDPAKATLVLHCDHAGEAVQSVREDESYQLEVTPQQARLTAPTPVGVLRGMETFLQLVDLDTQGFGAPAVRIADRPRFPWRGLDDRRLAPLDSRGGLEAQYRRHGGGKAQCAAPSPYGRPGLSYREQEISQAARTGLGRPLLHPGPDDRVDRLRARPRHSRRPGN